MADREKVVKGMECCVECAALPNCTECPYSPYGEENGICQDKLFSDALAILKAQEPRDFHDGFIGLSEQAFSNPQPVKPNVIMHGKMVMYYQCPACLRTIDPGDRFCRHCGRKVKWDD